MRTSEPTIEQLPDEVRDVLRRFIKEAGRVFGTGLQAVVLYGSAARGEYLEGRSNVNLLLVLDQHDRARLQQYAKGHQRWSRDRVVVPLFLTADEIERSHQLFPLEYSEIAACHHVMLGRDPFIGVDIDRRYLALQCRQEIRGNRLRLRQRFVEGGGTTEAIAILLPLSLTSLLIAVRGAFRAAGLSPTRASEGVIRDLKTHLSVDSNVFEDVWQLKRGVVSPGPAELPRLYDRYLSGLEAVDQAVSRFLPMEIRS